MYYDSKTHTWVVEESDKKAAESAKQYIAKNTDVQALYNETESKRKSVESTLSTNKYLTKDEISQMRNDLYTLDWNATKLAALGIVDKDYTAHVGNLWSANDSRLKFQNNFKSEGEYFNYNMWNKYGGKSYSQIDSIINSLNPTNATARERRWLMKNRDYVLSAEELLKGITDLENKIRGKQTREEANQTSKRLTEMKTAYASHSDVSSKDLENLYKQSDTNLFKILSPNYSYKDYKSDKASERIYAEGYYAKKEQEELAKINSDKRQYTAKDLYSDQIAKIREKADYYNSNTNGNVDYFNRPIVPASVVKAMYPDCKSDGYATTYAQTVTIGEGDSQYTIYITPILENGTVLSQAELDKYIKTLQTNGGMEGVLASDTNKLIINVAKGPYNKQYWDNFEKKISKVKDEHLDLVLNLQDQSGVSWNEIFGPVNVGTNKSYSASDLFELYYETADKLDAGYYDNKNDYGMARYQAEELLSKIEVALKAGGYDFNSVYDSYSRYKNREFTEKQNQDAKNAIESGAFGATVANIGSVATNIFSTLQTVPDTIKGVITDAKTDSPYIMDVNSSAWIGKNMTDAVRTATSEVIANGKTGKIGEFLYQTGMSTADFLATTAAAGFNPTASLMLMGTTAAADAVKQTSLKGGTATDAIVMGVISGGLEILLEKTPIDEIFKSVNTKSGRDAIKNVFSAMMSEGFEEFGSEIGNTVADLLINADQSDFKQRMFELMNTGMSSKDAALKVFGETMGDAALSFLGGALSGGAMAGAGNAFALYDRSRMANNIGSTINANGQVDALLNLAREIAGTNTADVQQDVNVVNETKTDVTEAEAKPKKTITDEEVIEGMSAGKSLEPTKASVTSHILGNDIDAKTLNKLADKATKKQSNKNMGKLYMETARTVSEGKSKAIETALHKELADRIVAVGGDKSIANRGADIIMKAYNDEKLTFSEKRILNGKNAVSRVYKEYTSVDNAYRSKLYSNEWVKDAELRAAEAGRNYDSYSDRAMSIISDEATAKTTDNVEDIETDTKTATPVADNIETVYKAVDSDGNNVSITGVGVLTDNNIEVTLSNGKTAFITDEETVQSDEVYIPDENTRNLVIASSNIRDVNIKNNMLRSFDGESDARTYTAEYSKAVFDGILGKKDKNAVNSKAISVDTYNQANSIGAYIKKGKVDACDISQGIVASKIKTGVTRAYGAKNIEKHLQKQINVLDAYGKKYGTSFIITDTIQGGKSNGVYLGGNKIAIALDSEGGALLPVAGHEIFHLIEQNDAESAKLIKHNIIENLKLKEDFDYDGRVRELMAMYNTDDVSAIESEMVGNAFFNVISDESVIRELSKDDGGLLKKVIKAINEFIDRILDSIKVLHWAEADALIDDLEYLAAIRSMCDTTLTALVNRDISEMGIVADSNGDLVHSLKANVDSPDNKFSYEKIAKKIVNLRKISKDEAKIEVERSFAAEKMFYLYKRAFDFDSDDRYEPIKNNSDYGRTVDLSNNCTKRVALTEAFEELQKRHPNVVYTAEDMASIRQFLKDKGITVSCGCCYVEDRRTKLGEIAASFIDEWTKAINEKRQLKSVNNEGKYKDISLGNDIAKTYGLKRSDTIIPKPDKNGNYYIPNQYDLTTYKGLYKLYRSHPDIAAAFVAFNNKRGMSSARLIEGRAEYNRQILKWGRNVVKSRNEKGGLRIYSFSDFEAVHMLDLIQIITDCDTVGLKIQGYTKQPEVAYLLKDTGVKLLRSHIPKGTGIKKVNGKKVLDLDLVEGINTNHEYYDKSDNPNIGDTIIGINDDHIRLAMKTPWIDQIIPFHSGKSEDVRNQLGTEGWVNYAGIQTEKYISSGKSVKKEDLINIYTDILDTKNPPKNKVEFVNAFLKLCKEKGQIPRFAKFLKKDANGDYIYTEGYEKLIVDFKMFDRVTGEILPHNTVKAYYDEKALKLMNDIAKRRDDAVTRNSNVSKEFIDGLRSKGYSEKLIERYIEIRDKDRFEYIDKETIDDLEKHIIGQKLKNVTGAEQTNVKKDKKWSADKYAAITGIKPHFSMKQYWDIKRDLEKSEAKYEDLKRANEELKKQLKYSRGRAITMNDAKNIAAEAISKYASTVKSTTLGKRLFDLFQWVDKVEGTDDFAWDFVMDTLIGEAREVIRNQDYYEDVDDYLLDIKREIQGTRFRLSEDIWHNTNDARSPYNRRAYGKFEVARYDDQSAIDLSQQWSVWQEQFGGPFNEVSSDSEMPDKLLEIWDLCTSPIYYDMVEINGYPDAETAAVALAHDMFEMYLESPSYQTYADKQKARREELKAQVKHYKSLVSSVKREMGKEYTEVKKQRDKLEEKLGLTEDKLKEIATEYKKTVAKLGRRDARLSATREELRTTKDKLKRRDKALDITRSILRETKEELKDVKHKEDLRVRAKMRTHVKARLDQLYRRYTNPKPGAYIPDGLKPIVKAFFEMFDGDEGYVKPEMMGAVMEQYRKLTEVSSSIETFYDPDMLETLDKLAKAMEVDRAPDGQERTTTEKLDAVVGTLKVVKGDSRLYKFDEQTTALFETVANHLFSLVSNANKTFIEGKKVEFDAVIADAIESYSKPMDKKVQAMFKMTNWNSTPYYFFKRLGGTFNKVYKDLMAGQHKSGLMLQQAKNAMSVIREKHNASSWMRDTERSIKVDTSYKEHLEFTVGEALGIYAVAKREASTPYKETNHLRGNGIIFTDKKGKDNRGIANHQLSDADVRKIIGQLTDEQIAYADDVIKYMSTTVAEWGNEISEQLHGYKKFTETAYYPYSVSDYEKSGSAMSADKPDDVVPLIKNRSHTRATVQGAQAAVKVEDFVKVANDHIKSMIDYHCLSIPQSVLNSIYSYKKGGKAITQMLDMNYDKTSSVYVRQFIKDISLGSSIDVNEQFIQKLLGKFKKNAVAMNVRVIVQQPSAIGRAMALVDPKYFLTKARNPSAGYEELKKYSGVAVIKEIGGFDVATGYGITNWIMQAPPENFKDKVKTFFDPKGSSYRDEIFGMGAQKADEITWVHIWEAVKKETADKNPSLKGEDLMIKAGLRFNEVIEATQVYDSVLARSQVMRSKTNTMKTLTSFMAEPTKRINMLYDAAYDFINGKDKKAAGKFLARTCGAIIVSAVLNSILKAPITAGRDDDETKSYIDKLLYALMNESMSDLSVLQGLPFIKDAISMVQGYEPSTGGMALLNDLIDSVGGLVNAFLIDKEGYTDAIVDAVGTLGAFAGVPAKNIMRDVEALMRIAMSAFDDKKPSKQSAKFSVLDGFVDMFEVNLKFAKFNPLGFMKPSEQDVYEAMLNGEDGEYEFEFDKLQAYLIYGGKSSEEAVDAIESKVNSLIKENFNNGSIDWATAEKLLLKYFPNDKEEHAAYWKLREWQAKAQNPDKSSFSKYDDLSNAILSGSNLEGAIDELISHGTDSDAIETKMLNVIKNAYFNDEIDLKKAEELLRKCMEYDKGNDDLALSVQDDTDVKRKLDIWKNSKNLPDGETYSPFDMLNAEIVAGKPLSDEAKQKLYDLDYKDSDIKAQIPKALKEAFLNGDIDIKEAERLLRGYSDSYGFKEKDIRRNLDIWENSKDLPKGETYSVWNALEAAVAEGKPITKEQRDKFTYLDYDDSTVNSHISKVVKNDYEEGTITRETAEKRLLDYKVIDINDYQDSDNPTEAANKAAANKVKVWDFKREHPESELTNEWTILDYVEAADKGITLDVFEKYYSESSNCKGVDADGDGKTDSGSKKKQILEVIDALPLTSEQKDVLYFQNNWSASRLYEAPWR